MKTTLALFISCVCVLSAARFLERDSSEDCEDEYGMRPRRLPFPFKFPLLNGPLSQVYYKIFRQAPKLVLPQYGNQGSNNPSYPSPNVYPNYRPEYGYGSYPTNNRRYGNAEKDSSSEREQDRNQYGSYEPMKQERNEGGSYYNQKSNDYGAQTDLPFLPIFKNRMAETQSSGEKGKSQKNNKKTTGGKGDSDDD